MGLVIGLLGGVASGKSAVAALMEGRGLLRIDADALAREVVETPPVAAAIAERFGRDLYADGHLDRARLAERAFADPGATAALNALVHPAVRERIARSLAAAGSRPVVLDVPLLLESPLHALVDEFVFVESDEAVREERARARGWAPGERRRREALQSDLAQKRAAAGHRLENNGRIDDLVPQVEALLEQLGVPI